MKKLITATALIVSLTQCNQLTDLNTDSRDCQTFSIRNYTTGEGDSDGCWERTAVTAVSGDEVQMMLYIHNTGNKDAKKVKSKVKINKVDNEFIVSSVVWADNVNEKEYRVSVLSDANALSFNGVSFYVGSEQRELFNDQTGLDILSSNGLIVANEIKTNSEEGYLFLSFSVD